MSRRIEVELTSTRDDGTWTWRAAGAKQPKGVLDAGLLYEGARVGDVVRAEADFEMEGITITLVLPPKEKRAEAPRLEVIGPPREHQAVTSSLVPKSERPPRRDRDRDRDGPRGDRPSGPRPPRDGARGDRPPRTDGQRPEGRARPPRTGNDDRPRTARPERERGPRGDRERPGRPERASRPAGPPRHREPAPPAEPAPKPKKLSPANVHRAAAVEALPPEQQPIAEQVLRGGIPAVRQAIEAQNARLREEGQPEVQGGPLLAIAEQLLPQLKAAEWRDRAQAATKIVDEVSLRDLRSVVAGADLARDDEGRILAGELRQALERRLEEQREKWVSDMAGALDEGRLVRALRLSAHPPDTSLRLPAELATRLSEEAGTAMSADTSPDRWSTLLEAVADSPVRRTVKPTALPAEPGEPLLQAARQASGRVPALAAMLGIAMPPPPGPPRPARAAGRPPRTGPPPRRRPPAPPTPPAAAATPAPDEGTPAPEGPATDEAPAPTPVDEAPAAVEAPAPVDEAPPPDSTPGAPAADTAVDEASAPGAESPAGGADGPTSEAPEPAESTDASPLPPAPAIDSPPPAAEGDQLGGVTPEEPVGSADER